MPTDDKPKGMKFSLKQTETNLIRFIKVHQDAIFSAALSTIAADRLAYHVTENTQFHLDENLQTVTIWEKEPAATQDQQVVPENNAIRTAE